MKFIALTIAACAALLVATPHASRADSLTPQPALSACVWSHVSDADKADLAASYHQAAIAGIDTHMKDFTNAIGQKDAAMAQAFRQCDATPNVPKLLWQSLISTEAIEFGAANELAASRQINRADLDSAWAEAPETARQCVMAHGAKTFGLNDRTCPDPKSTFWFLTRFGIVPKELTMRNDGAQILIFIDAKAQEDWATALIDKFDTQAAAKPN